MTDLQSDPFGVVKARSIVFGEPLLGAVAHRRHLFVRLCGVRHAVLTEVLGDGAGLVQRHAGENAVDNHENRADNQKEQHTAPTAPLLLILVVVLPIVFRPRLAHFLHPPQKPSETSSDSNTVVPTTQQRKPCACTLPTNTNCNSVGPQDGQWGGLYLPGTDASADGGDAEEDGEAERRVQHWHRQVEHHVATEREFANHHGRRQGRDLQRTAFRQVVTHASAQDGAGAS